MLRNWIKVVWKHTRKHPGYALINIAGLAVGLAFAMLIFLWVRLEVSVDRFHEHLVRLHLVAFSCEGDSYFGGATVGATAGYLKETYPEITHATRWSLTPHWQRLRSADDTPFSSYGRYADPDFLEMFTFPMVRGNPDTALVDPSSIVITESLADKLFGKIDVVGESVREENGSVYMVSGVLADPPLNTQLSFQFLVPAETGGEYYDKWDIKCLQTYVMLADDSTDPQVVSDKIRNIYNDHNPGTYPNDYYLSQFSKQHLYNLGGGGRIVYVLVFSALATAVLLIACINFMNLATARAELRFKEIGVKKTIGASRAELVLQFLGESLLLSLVAFFLAVVLLEWMLPALGNLVRLPLQLTLVWSNLPGLLAIALLTGIIAGSYPAFYLSSLRPLAVLSSRRPGRSFASHFRTAMVRKVLVVGQFTVSIIFLVAIVVIVRQLGYLRTMDLGYDRDHIAVVNLPESLARKAPIVKTELLQHPDISAASVSTMTVTSWNTSFGIDWPGEPEDRVFDVGYNEVDHDFLDTFGLEMVAGRFFSRDHFTDQQSACVVNQALVQAMGVVDPIGVEVTISPDTSFESRATVIGVIEDFHTESAHKRVRPFLLRLTSNGGLMWLRVAGHDIGATLRFIRNTVKGMAPDSYVGCRLLNDELGRLYTIERLTGLVIALMTSLAVFISCLGLLGLTAFTAEQRTKEIGIRKVLGAEVRDILRLLLREIVVLVAIAGVIACPIAYLVMSRWLETFAFHISVSPQVLLSATMAVLVLALLAVMRQARRAAVANPIDAIRYE
jgi:predicted permease